VCVCARAWTSILLVPIRSGYNVGVKENKPNFAKLKRKYTVGQWSLSVNNMSFVNVRRTMCERAHQLQCLVAVFCFVFFFASLYKLFVKFQLSYVLLTVGQSPVKCRNPDPTGTLFVICWFRCGCSSFDYRSSERLPRQGIVLILLRYSC
jgi:hypothetical protein